MPYTYTLISFFQSLLPRSRPMTSHHVTCHVTTVTCLFLINKEKEKENQNKRNIKSRKINKRKRKMLGFKHIITDELKQCSMIDDEVTLTHFIHSG